MARKYFSLEENFYLKCRWFTIFRPPHHFNLVTRINTYFARNGKVCLTALLILPLYPYWLVSVGRLVGGAPEYGFLNDHRCMRVAVDRLFVDPVEGRPALALFFFLNPGDPADLPPSKDPERANYRVFMMLNFMIPQAFRNFRNCSAISAIFMQFFRNFFSIFPHFFCISQRPPMSISAQWIPHKKGSKNKAVSCRQVQSDNAHSLQEVFRKKK